MSIVPKWSCLIFLFLSIVLPSALLAQEDVCAGYESNELIRRFGPNAISPEHVDDLPDLQRLATIHRAELEAVLNSQGMGHLAPQIFEAIDKGQVDVRPMAQGEEFAWMAYRKGGVATASGRLCLASTRSYEAFEIKVTEKVTTPAKATCSLKVSGDCATGKITVDASGSTAGAKVMSGSRSILSGSNTKAEIDFADRFTTDPTFTVTADATGSTTTTTHTFIIPKVCLNLAYDGKPQKSAAPVVDSCTQTARVDRCPAVAEPELAVGDPGAAGVAQEPDAGAEHKWTARGYLGSLSPSSDELVRTGMDLVGVNPGLDERTALHLSSGNLIGAGVEYHFTPVIGLMGDLAFGRMDGHFMFDSSVAWLMDDDGVDYTSLTIGPTFHLTGNRRVDVFVSPFVGYFDLGSANFNLGNGITVNRELDGGFGFGAMLGVDIGFGATQLWGLHLGARITDLDADVNNNGQELGEVKIDPLQFEAGFRRRF